MDKLYDIGTPRALETAAMLEPGGGAELQIFARGPRNPRILAQQYENTIFLYQDRTANMEEAAGFAAHEASHVDDFLRDPYAIYTQEQEMKAHMWEAEVNANAQYSDPYDIAVMVSQEYAHLPSR